MRVLVVGAGVTGLTVGVRLAEQGHDVHLLARELPLETTSVVAAALWYPYRIRPYDRVLGWSRRSLDVFTALAADETDSGVTLRAGTEMLRERTPDPWWAPIVPSLERVGVAPTPYVDGWSFTAPVIEMPVYLPWLQARLEAAGGTVSRMALRSLPDRGDVVINCAGLGARALTGDESVQPVRGQLLLVAQVGLDRWSLDGAGPTYVIPRSRDIVVGGTDDEGSWDRHADSATGRRILARAKALVPELDGVRVLGHRVGLRPARPTVRLEAENLRAGGLLVHCYGHGGAGITVSWGCADEVAALVSSASSTPAVPTT